jgi:hypothetical protein
MSDQLPARTRPRPPGHDEILVTAPPGRCLCNSLEHARLNCLADVVVTFGELGTAWQRGALWQSNWGKAFAVCTGCWDAIREVAQARRPGLVIRDHRQPAPAPGPAGAS